MPTIKYFFLLIFITVLSSCLKKDAVYKLPAQTGSSYMQVNLNYNVGAYDSVVYVSLENNTIVKSVNRKSWDLAFETATNGFHVMINSANDARILNTHFTNLNQVTTVNNNVLSNGYDSTSQLMDSTYIGNWLNTNNVSKNEVFVINLYDDTLASSYFKFQLVSVDANNYVIKYAALKDTTFNIMTINKNANYNFSYFSFANDGSTPMIEPPKTDWDLVFTKYGDNATEFGVTLYYPVTGVLLNSYSTTASADETQTNYFSTYTFTQALAMTYTNRRNIIGWHWKDVDANYNYTVFSQKIYCVRNQNNQLFKLHFIDYYYLGVRGFPKFEFERIQ